MPTRMPTIGELRHRLWLYNPAEAVNDFGDTTQLRAGGPNAPGRFMYGRVDGLGGLEFDRARAVEADSTDVVWVRYRKGLAVTPKMFFLFDGRKLNVVNVSDPDGRRRWLRVECKEATNAAAV